MVEHQACCRIYTVVVVAILLCHSFGATATELDDVERLSNADIHVDTLVASTPDPTNDVERLSDVGTPIETTDLWNDFHIEAGSGDNRYNDVVDHQPKLCRLERVVKP